MEDIKNIIDSDKDLTGFSIILVSFQGDRTVLAHRGANAHVSEKEVNQNGRISDVKAVSIIRSYISVGDVYVRRFV